MVGLSGVAYLVVDDEVNTASNCEVGHIGQHQGLRHHPLHRHTAHYRTQDQGLSHHPCTDTQHTT